MPRRPAFVPAFRFGERVEIHPRFDQWMRGDRYGEVVKHSPRFGVYVKMDKSGKTLRFAPDDLTALGVNPYGARAKYRHRRLRAPGRFVPGSFRLTKVRKGVRVVVGRLKGERRRVRRGRRKGRAVLTPQSVLTRKRNPAHSERTAWATVATKAAELIAHEQASGGGGRHGPALAKARAIEHIAKAMLVQLERGIHANPQLAVFGNPPLLSRDVQAVLYRHAEDGKDYVHPFGTGLRVKNKRDGSTVVRAATNARSGVRALLLADGSVLLRHPSKRIWGDF